MPRRLGVSLCLIFLGATAFGATQGGPIPVPLPLFPNNNWWNTEVKAAPLDGNSAAFITYINSNNDGTPHIRQLHPDWGGDNGDGTLYGFPYILVDGTQPKTTVTFDPQAEAESDGVGLAFYPIPDEAITQYGWIEQGPPGNQDIGGDRHMLIVDTTNNYLYELYNVFYDQTPPTPHWNAYSGAFFNMNTNNRRPEGWTSADAAGLAVLPGLVRYDEVFGPNEITHAFRFTVRRTNGYVYPASHKTSSYTGALPMGARLRMKSGTNISSYPAYIQKIFRAMKNYGLIVADNGSDMFIQGVYDNRWDMDAINDAFNDFTASDFEVIQQGWQSTTSFIFTLPSVFGAGDSATGTLTAYNSNYTVNTGYTGTVRFTSSDGAAILPVDYTFIGGDAGVHTFAFTLNTAGGQTVTVTDNANATITVTRNVVVGPKTPTNLAAAASSTAQVDISWTGSPTATQYEILRSTTPTGYASLATIGGTAYSDTAVAANATYLYKVRAIDAGARLSPLSAPDAATTKLFTDDPLITNTTVVKATHIVQLRQAVDIMRAAAGLGGGTYTNADPTGLVIQKIHIEQLRTALDEARAALGLSAIAYTDPTLTTSTTVKKAHIDQLRNGIK